VHLHTRYILGVQNLGYFPPRIEALLVSSFLDIINGLAASCEAAGGLGSFGSGQDSKPTVGGDDKCIGAGVVIVG
jgi:hypothetical protein